MGAAGTADDPAGPVGPELALAVGLGGATTLSASIDLVLPALAAASGAQIAVFAVAGSTASGARCWPSDADWSRSLERELGSLWEVGPLTDLCRSLGVVPPFAVEPLLARFGWSALPFELLVDGAPLAHLVYLAVATAGRTVCGYFLGRTDRAFSAAELDGLARRQPVLVASHGPFLRGAGHSVPLTPRQRDILRLMHQGLTGGAIASRLRISESTVGKHVHDLYTRLDTHDRVSTVREAQVRGLLDGLAGAAWQDLRFR